jgi:carboxymethylenebutenolidase
LIIALRHSTFHTVIRRDGLEQHYQRRVGFLMNQIKRRLLGLLIMTWTVSPLAHAQMQVRERVRQYQSGEARVTVECFSPAAGGKLPAILMLHGSGGLELATGTLFRETARGLARKGYVVLIPHFFEKTGHVQGAPFQESEFLSYMDSVHDAVEFAVSNGVDPERIGIVGLSLGSSLAFSRAERDPRIKAIVSVSGSLPVHSESSFPPLLIFQGAKDKSLPLTRLKEFQATLAAREIPCEAHVYRHAGHNFDVNTWDDASRRMGVFFGKYLKQPQPKPTKPSRNSTPKASQQPPLTPSAPG